jgi:hypothetical protein
VRPEGKLSLVNRRQAPRPVLQSPRIQEALGPHHSPVISAFILQKHSRLPSSLPVGRHPLQLYSLGTPNGVKVTIMLE